MPSGASQHQGQHQKPRSLPRHAAWVLLTQTKFQTSSPVHLRAASRALVLSQLQLGSFSEGASSGSGVLSCQCAPGHSPAHFSHQPSAPKGIDREESSVGRRGHHPTHTHTPSNTGVRRLKPDHPRLFFAYDLYPPNFFFGECSKLQRS